MRKLIYLLFMLVMVCACGNTSHQGSTDLNTTCLESLQTHGRVDTLVIKVEALNIEVVETCFNLNYVPVKIKPNE